MPNQMAKIRILKRAAGGSIPREICFMISMAFYFACICSEKGFLSHLQASKVNIVLLESKTGSWYSEVIFRFSCHPRVLSPQKSHRKDVPTHFFRSNANIRYQLSNQPAYTLARWLNMQMRAAVCGAAFCPPPRPTAQFRAELVLGLVVAGHLHCLPIPWPHLVLWYVFNAKNRYPVLREPFLKFKI